MTAPPAPGALVELPTVPTQEGSALLRGPQVVAPRHLLRPHRPRLTRRHSSTGTAAEGAEPPLADCVRHTEVDLEARCEVERVPRSSPQRIRRPTAESGADET